MSDRQQILPSATVQTLRSHARARPCYQSDVRLETDGYQGIEFEEEQCVPEAGGIVTLEYKTKAVAFWKSGKKTQLSLQSVKHKFRKVSSVYQLYRIALFSLDGKKR
ncbi:uncharacterized protein LOC143376239 [Andrena cerasifolii]|uniref:uncharacterized protein LOC143376239 n=1 Tax=Andrena cerasifolii TaxID=2819439 RepID=UPI00403811F2